MNVWSRGISSSLLSRVTLSHQLPQKREAKPKITHFEREPCHSLPGSNPKRDRKYCADYAGHNADASLNLSRSPSAVPTHPSAAVRPPERALNYSAKGWWRSASQLWSAEAAWIIRDRQVLSWRLAEWVLINLLLLMELITPNKLCPLFSCGDWKTLHTHTLLVIGQSLKGGTCLFYNMRKNPVCFHVDDSSA